MATRIQLNLSDFFRDLQRVKDEHTRAVMRFQLGLAQDILHTAQDNILRLFGKGRGSKSELTMRAYGSSARRKGRGGGLFNSGTIFKKGDQVSVSFGGLGVPYAAIHEYGGTIRATKAKALTIPFGPKYAGTRAREHDLVIDQDEKWGAVLREKGPSKSESSIAFLLRRSVQIPARPYLGPAVEKVTSNARTRQLMRVYLGKNDLDIRVE